MCPKSIAERQDSATSPVREDAVSGRSRAGGLDVGELLRRHRGENYDLHAQHVNPKFAKVLRILGFDHCYERAEGAYLWDAAGNRYLDCIGGHASVNTGRNHPVVKQALIDFLATDYPSLVQFDAPLLAGVLAAELKKRVGNDLDYVFFTNSGTESIEAAIKFAKCATRRSSIVYADHAFHGLTSGSLSINGEESFREGFGPLLPGCSRVPFNDLEALEQALSRKEVAAFVVEPIQGKGVNLPAPGYLERAAALCRKYGSLFVADEVQTGVGRTGTFLALEQEGDVQPDIVALSKSLSGGYVPVGAVLTRKSIWSRVFSSLDRAIVHSSTFHQGSLAMIAGLATLHVLDGEDLMGNAARMGGLLREGLEELLPRFEFMHEVRQRGLMIGIQLGEPKSLGLRATWSLINKADRNLFPQAVVIPLMDDHRILTQVAGHNLPVIKLVPPLVIDEGDVQ